MVLRVTKLDLRAGQQSRLGLDHGCANFEAVLQQLGIFIVLQELLALQNVLLALRGPFCSVPDHVCRLLLRKFEWPSLQTFDYQEFGWVDNCLVFHLNKGKIREVQGHVVLLAKVLLNRHSVSCSRGGVFDVDQIVFRRALDQPLDVEAFELLRATGIIRHHAKTADLFVDDLEGLGGVQIAVLVFFQPAFLAQIDQIVTLVSFSTFKHATHDSHQADPGKEHAMCGIQIHKQATLEAG